MTTLHTPRSIMTTIIAGDVVTTDLYTMNDLFRVLEMKGNVVINQFIGEGQVKLMTRGKKGLIIGVSCDIGGDDFYGFQPTRVYTITYYPFVGDTGKTEGDTEPVPQPAEGGKRMSADIIDWNEEANIAYFETGAYYDSDQDAWTERWLDEHGRNPDGTEKEGEQR